jgi:RluA family pseudouridine synthase
MASILYFDERLIVINKPAGISLATRRADPNEAARRLMASIPEASRLELGLNDLPHLVHRLDVATTGIVLLARDRETHRTLSQWMSSKRIRKFYLALVWGHPRPPRGAFDSPLAPDRRDRRKMKTDPAGSPSRTRYRTLIAAPYISALELEPETGRTHQIRVHLASSGHPIVGDDLYGGPRHHSVKDAETRNLLNPPHLLLHAWKLALPEDGGFLPCHFEAPFPEAFSVALDHIGFCRLNSRP